jgi:uncharacterized membrane protein YgaE (UPF0421/DUF939 family)
MEQRDRFSINRVKLQAFDLSERTARLGRRSARERWERWRNRWFLIAQCAVTAGLAWFVANRVLAHPTPVFGPVAAVICLGVTFGHRLSRGIEVAIGVAVGVAVGVGFVHWFGTGIWQVIVVVAASMSLATLLGAGQLMILQAGVQSIVVTTLLPQPELGFDRWVDAVVGCVLALGVAAVAPSGPLRRPGRLAAEILSEFAGTLEEAAGALRRGDEAGAEQVLERARAAERRLTALDEAAAEGLAVVRQSPFRRRQLSSVQAFADLWVPLDRASRNLRVLVRRCATAIWRGESVPPAYLDVLERLAATMQTMAADLTDGRLPRAAREPLRQVAEDTSHLAVDVGMSAIVILAQSRSLVTDLLQLTGLDAAAARELIPDMG